MVWIRVLAAVLVILLCGPAFAHCYGDIIPDPGPIPPPPPPYPPDDIKDPDEPDRGTPPVWTPPEAPKTGVPGASTPLAGSRPAPSPDRRGARTPTGSTGPRWERWWYYNRCRFVPVSPLVRASTPTLARMAREEREAYRSTGVTALLGALDDDHVEPATAAAVALGKAEASAAVARLAAWLREAKTERTRRESAALALGMIGGEEARRALRATLADDEEAWRVRAFAAVGLGLAKDTSAVPALVQAARSDHREVRSAAYVALGILGEPLVLPLLLDTAKDRRGRLDPRERAAALHALGRLGSPEALETLLTAVRDDRPEVRRAAVQALGRTRPEDPRVHRVLLAAVRRDRDALARAYAAIALGRTGSPRGVATLVEALDGPRLEQRAFAALGLALLGRGSEDTDLRGKIGDLLLTKLAGRLAFDTQGAVVIALGVLEERRAVEPLRRILSRASSPVIRGHVAVALGMLRDYEAVPELRRLLVKERSPWGQREIAIALGLLRDAAAVDALLDLVRRGSTEFVRGNAALALGRLSTPRAARAMVKLLDPQVASGPTRGMVAAGLGYLLERRALPALFAISEDFDYRLELETFRELLRIL